LKGKLSGSWKLVHKRLNDNKGLIIEMFQSGESVKDIAEKYDVSEYHVRRYIRACGRRRGIKYLLSKIIKDN